ncbi:hypothetical protein ESCOMMO111M_22075 [Escherichia coli]
MISIKSYFNWNKLFVFLAVALYWFWRILYRMHKADASNAVSRTGDGILLCA